MESKSSRIARAYQVESPEEGLINPSTFKYQPRIVLVSAVLHIVKS